MFNLLDELAFGKLPIPMILDHPNQILNRFSGIQFLRTSHGAHSDIHALLNLHTIVQIFKSN